MVILTISARGAPFSISFVLLSILSSGEYLSMIALNAISRSFKSVTISAFPKAITLR